MFTCKWSIPKGVGVGRIIVKLRPPGFGEFQNFDSLIVAAFTKDFSFLTFYLKVSESS